MKKVMKKVLFLLTAVVIVVIASLVFRDKYVYLEKTFVERKTENIDVFHSVGLYQIRA